MANIQGASINPQKKGFPHESTIIQQLCDASLVLKQHSGSEDCLSSRRSPIHPAQHIPETVSITGANNHHYDRTPETGRRQKIMDRSQ